MVRISVIVTLWIHIRNMWRSAHCAAMLEHVGKGKQPPTENKSAAQQCGAVTPRAKGQGPDRNPGKKVGQAQIAATGLQLLRRL